ncbi:hypothetical protein [Bradyrhizobium sp. CB3481]|uniref:hypothetical protein n=1 Tax=Bradyrhizobium sp. CB3481 TaxID=3039158 RepID=UPI0024B13481|nr:hypothetical protein [Bradyrhizobium sp. CB3481]WFU14474.1 hypothetical protein QA643_25215 [Bradyrhizobium sp. CB3481]
MSYIYGLLGGFFKIQKTVQAEGRYSGVAQQFSKAKKDSEDNVVYVDFKSISKSEKGS